MGKGEICRPLDIMRQYLPVEVLVLYKVIAKSDLSASENGVFSLCLQRLTNRKILFFLLHWRTDLSEKVLATFCRVYRWLAIWTCPRVCWFRKDRIVFRECCTIVSRTKFSCSYQKVGIYVRTPPIWRSKPSMHRFWLLNCLITVNSSEGVGNGEFSLCLQRMTYRKICSLLHWTTDLSEKVLIPFCRVYRWLARSTYPRFVDLGRTESYSGLIAALLQMSCGAGDTGTMFSGSIVSACAYLVVQDRRSYSTDGRERTTSTPLQNTLLTSGGW